jgi:hypothetical protein
MFDVLARATRYRAPLPWLLAAILAGVTRRCVARRP